MEGKELAATAVNQRPSLLALVLGFGWVGVTAFGGNIHTHLSQLCLSRGWLTEGEFLTAFSWCQNLPGPNATNLSAYLGYRFGGAIGAMLATLALVTPGMIGVFLIAGLLAHLPTVVVHGALTAVAAAGVGLLVGTTGHFAKAALDDRLSILVACLVFVAVAWGHIPTPLVIGLALPLVWRRKTD
ncbi:MAG: chromate transporter [Candidatus Sericytochromatia bacterium]|nr:chromate transporter [Candidatus Sericytochromatia bacterium]